MSNLKGLFQWLYEAFFGRWSHLADPLPIERAEQVMEIAVQDDEPEVQIEQVEIKVVAA